MSTSVNKFCTIASGPGVSFVVVSFSRQQAEHLHDAIYDAVCEAIESARAAYKHSHIRITLMAPPGPVPLWRIYWEARAKLKKLRAAHKAVQLTFNVTSTAGDGLTIMDRGVAQCLCIALGVTWSGVCTDEI